MAVTSVIMYIVAVISAAAILLKGRKAGAGGRLYALTMLLEVVLLLIASYLYKPGAQYIPALDIFLTPILILTPLLYWFSLSKMADTADRGKPFIIAVICAAVCMTAVFAVAVLSDVDGMTSLYRMTRGEVPEPSEYPSSLIILARIDIMRYYVELCVSLVTMGFILASFLSYRRTILNTFSNPESKSLPEMYMFIVTLLAKTLVVIAVSVLNFSFIRDWIVPARDITFALFFIAQAIIICRMKYSAVELRELYASKKADPSADEKSEEEKSAVDSPSAALIAERLEKIIAERFYTKKDINIVDLSYDICVNREYVSKYIRARYNETFSGYISRLRVEYAKDLLTDPNARVAEVGEAVGFGNISTFYRNFSAIVGCSPKEWQMSNAHY